MLLPSFAQDFEQIAKFDPATGSFSHYVGNPKFDDFADLEYGVGYQVYCKAASPVTVPIKGKLPTRRLSTSLAPGWHLLPAITYHPSPITAAFGGVDYDQVLRYDGSTLQPASEVQAAQAYYVQVRTTSTWTPPLPKDVTTRSVYDGDGGRVKQITATGTTKFLGQSYEVGPDGAATKYIFAGSQRIAAKDTSGLRFYHGDHLGSSNVITNGSGQLVELTEHTPYGSISHHEGTVNVPQKFTGQRLDASTGLYFYNARYYDPSLGRFISPDPFVQAPSNPQTLNRYSYALNNPIRYVDPSGYGFWNWFFGFYFAAAAVVLFVVAGFSFLTGAEPVAAATFQAGVWAAGMSAANFKAAVNDAGSSPGLPGVEDTDPFLQPEGPLLLQSPISKGAGGPALPTEAAIAAADLPLESSWGPDDAIYALIGIGVAAKAATVAARQLGPAAWAGLRSLASETGAARLGAESPTLSSAFRNAFQGVRYRTFKPGEKLYRSPWVPQEIASKPGRWFGTRQAVTKAGAKSLYNVRQGNPLQVMRVYEVIKEVTLPYGRVYGGTGFQALFPGGMIPAEYLRYVAEAVLK